MHERASEDRNTGFDPVEWIEANVELTETTAAQFWFERMPSQSGERLAVVYVPFDPTDRGHFADRGQILDFAISTGGGRVLDFGPGDGWPSLLMAPMVKHVVGVDGSKHRAEVCAANAARLGISNAEFVHVAPGEPLPFADASFDGVTAASSVESSPDPKATLAELHRVLRPGGRLRIYYESLGYYLGRERQVAWAGPAEGPVAMLLFDRHIEDQCAGHFALAFDMPRKAVFRLIRPDAKWPGPDDLTEPVMKRLAEAATEAATWHLEHPSCRTLLGWLADAGFSSARATCDGGWFARKLFDQLPPSDRPADMGAVDEMLRPLIPVVLEMDRPSESIPGQWDPWVTAVK